MLSGRRLDIADPSPFDVEVEDIALGLARISRWNGQTVGLHGFSVAQHCTLVVALMRASRERLPRPVLLAGLLHDAAEYVVSDLVSPFKRMVGERFAEVEAAVERAVRLRFGLPAELPPQWAAAIKRADMQAAYAEAVSVAGFTVDEAKRTFGFRGPPPKGLDLAPWGSETARHRFLELFGELHSPS